MCLMWARIWGVKLVSKIIWKLLLFKRIHNNIIVCTQYHSLPAEWRKKECNLTTRPTPTRYLVEGVFVIYERIHNLESKVIQRNTDAKTKLCNFSFPYKRVTVFNTIRPSIFVWLKGGNWFLLYCFYFSVFT